MKIMPWLLKDENMKMAIGSSFFLWGGGLKWVDGMWGKKRA